MDDVHWDDPSPPVSRNPAFDGAAQRSKMVGVIWEPHVNSLCPPLPDRSSRGNQLLTTVDVVGRTGQSGIDHQVNGERRHVGRANDAPNGKAFAEFLPTLFKSVAQECCRKRRVNEAW